VVTVPREAAGQRLDRFLATALAGEGAGGAPSRSELQRWIEHGRVTVNGAAQRAAEKVRAGAEIVVVPEAPAKTDAQPETGIAFAILFEDDALIVIDKPPGLVVHPAKGHAGGTLVNGLLGMGIFASADAMGDDRPGIVHRLDKGTSGVMVVAKTPQAREKLKEQFAAHTIERAYEAIAVGKVEARTIATLHGRHPTDRVKFSSKVLTGKRAVTHVAVLESLAGGLATHVRCTLETGRTHQIRVHLAEGGNPILGDALYGKPPKSPLLREMAAALGHQALHARVLGFVHPVTGLPVRFESPPPADFRSALEALRRAGPGAGA
jgi:23S rRNA pseudouridine1911/1915/1917 synthase